MDENASNVRGIKQKTPQWCLLLFGWLSVSLFPSVVHAETIRLTTIDYCPFTCDPSKEDGKEGFMTDVLREAFEQGDYTLQIRMQPYVRAVRSVQDGKYDGIVVVGKDYAPDLVYPDIPTVKQRVVFLVNSEESWKYTGVDSLPQVTVGIVKGFHYVDPDLVSYLEKERSNKERVVVMHGDTTTKRGLRMLDTDRITTFLEGEYSVMYELRKMDIRDTVAIAGYTKKAFDDYTGFSPHHPDAGKYARILSDKLRELKKSGRLAEILRRYGIYSGKDIKKTSN